MRIALTLLVRDEQDVLDETIAHHLALGVDVILATDHRSVDATPAILARHAATGRVVVRRVEDPGYHQSRWVTEMARAAAVEHGADWVLHGDADELWWAGGDDLHAVLDAVPPQVGVVSAERHDVLPIRAPGAHPFDAVVRRRVSCNELGRVIQPKVAHRADPDVELPTGNHAVARHRLPAVWSEQPLTIYHYPLRSPEQYQRRVRNYVESSGALEHAEPFVHRWQELGALDARGALLESWQAQVPGPAEMVRLLGTGDLLEDRTIADFRRGRGRLTA